MSAATLKNVLDGVLSIAGKEQSAMYPPRVFSRHVNIVTNFILDRLVEMWSDTQMIVDIGRPFIETKALQVKGGQAEFAEDYRNMLGIAMNVTPGKKKKDCGCKDKEDRDFGMNDPLAKTDLQKDKVIDKSKCISHDLELLDIDEFGNRTTHSYKMPTMEKPIACIKKGKVIKVCPFDISYIEVTYLKKPKEYVFGYKENPDHTYEFDPNTSEELEWEDTAMQYLVRGVSSLYSIYTRDGEMQNWNEILKKDGLI